MPTTTMRGRSIVGGGGQGIMGTAAAKAVSVGSHVKGAPHGRVTALTGITEGAKKRIAAIRTVLTALRTIMVAPAFISRRIHAFLLLA
jgi:predicted Rossmann-fold nucleotide-binding protein